METIWTEMVIPDVLRRAALVADRLKVAPLGAAGGLGADAAASIAAAGRRHCPAAPA